MRMIGYARVSTHDQDTALQIDALRHAGCALIYEDTASGARRDRAGLAEAIDACERGDVLTVWKLDRLGRSLPHLIDTVTDLDERGVGFRSLTEAIDTTTHTGRLVFHIFGALAQFERDLIRERVVAGIATARAAGRVGGRPISDPDRLEAAQRALADGASVSDAARLAGLPRSTVSSAVKRRRIA